MQEQILTTTVSFSSSARDPVSSDQDLDLLVFCASNIQCYC